MRASAIPRCFLLFAACHMFAKGRAILPYFEWAFGVLDFGGGGGAHNGLGVVLYRL